MSARDKTSERCGITVDGNAQCCKVGKSDAFDRESLTCVGNNVTHEEEDRKTCRLNYYCSFNLDLHLLVFSFPFSFLCFKVNAKAKI